MFLKTKNALIGLLLVFVLTGCAAQTSPNEMSSMKMDPAMCKQMMGEKKCCCCQKMQCMDSMRTSGMMTGGMPMQNCKPETTNDKKAPAATSKAPAAVTPEDHKEHHPEKQ